MSVSTLMPCALALVGAPLLLGITNRTKAIFAGRHGPPIGQTYFDLWKLLHKGAVFSRTTTWVFRAGPVIGLASVLVATLLLPFGGCRAPIHFAGDLILFAFLLGLARMFTVLAALDTGSSFEGMGASREVLFSALAEPSLLLALAAVTRQTDSVSLSGMHLALATTAWAQRALLLNLVAVVLVVLLLAENSRIPVDDPNTHLELTMIHEVMVLDHGGPDLAFILYAAALKLWLFGALIVDLVIPARFAWSSANLALALGGCHGGAGRPARSDRVHNGATSDEARARALDRRGYFGRSGTCAGTRRGPLVNTLVDPILVFVVLVNLALLGSSWLAACVRLSAVQGMAVGVLPLFVASHGIGFRVGFLAVFVFVLKGVIFPRLLLRAIRSADVRHEVEPIVGYAASILSGILMLALSFWIAARFSLPRPVTSPRWFYPWPSLSPWTGLFLINQPARTAISVCRWWAISSWKTVYSSSAWPSPRSSRSWSRWACCSTCSSRSSSWES